MIIAQGRCRMMKHIAVRTLTICATLAAGVIWGVGHVSPAHSAYEGTLVEVPSYRLAISSGELKPIAERIPEDPLIVDLEAKGLATGKNGGSINTLIDKAKSIRYMVVWGYARLVGYSQNYELEPDLLKSVDVEEGRIFTFNLRRGHKWSDGHPFTAEDFRYYWEDIANNEKLSPSGPLADLLVDGKPPIFEVLDDVTVRYTWHKPNPTFLPLLAKSRPPFIYRPAHYLKQFHAKYGDQEKIEKLVKKKKVQSWASLHNRNDNMYKFKNIDLPTLQPWVNTTRKTKTRYVLKRNPYFHRIDTKGQQLPYIDQVIATVASSKLIPAKTVAGETDLQARGLSFSNIAILKHGERAGTYDTNLWPISKSANLALYPNLNTQDETWRKLFRMTEFRQALSMAIDRKLVNRTLYLGLGNATGNAVLKSSPLFKAEYGDRWAKYDPDQANAILDKIGLTEWDSSGFRLLPDGRRAEIIVETAGENPDEIEMLQLISETWRQIGVKVYPKPSQRDVLRERSYVGATVMTAWAGWDNGTPSPNMSPRELAPTRQDNLAWPMWGQFFETKGKSGEAPDVDAAGELLELYQAWRDATDSQEREKIWKEMLEIHANENFIIGVVSGVTQPVVVSKKLRNVPKEGVYGWDPGSQFGIYRPDQFWLAN